MAEGTNIRSRFTITWVDGRYTVSIPNYVGGDVIMKDAVDGLVEALRFYSNPQVYKPHPHGSAFDDRDLSHVAKAAITRFEAFGGLA